MPKPAEIKGSREKALAESLVISIVDTLKSKALENNLSDEQIKLIFSKEIASQITIPKDSVPIEIFKNRKLSALESIAKYLKENVGHSFAKMSQLTNRSNKTFWTTYQKARKKMPERFSFETNLLYIPLSILKHRNLGIQEAIVKYLKEKHSLSYHEIAVLLNRNDRTIWTVYQRTRKKSESLTKKDN